MEKRKQSYKRIIWLVAVFQIILAVYCVGNLLKEKEQITFTEESLQIYGGGFDENGVYSVNEASGEEGTNCLVAGPLNLKPGVYQVSFFYQTDAEQVTSVKDETVGYRKLLSNAVSLYPTPVMKECLYRFTLLEPSEALNITVKYTGNGVLQIKDVCLTHTRQEYSMFLFVTMLLMLLAEVVLYYFGYSGKKLSREEKQIWFGLGVIGILASMPLFVDYIVWGDDLFFHLARIEGIAQGWGNGMFPVRMHGYMMEGMGYPTSIMYGDVFVWIAAFLRYVGFDLSVAYKGYILFTNVLTILISYISFKNIFRDKYVGLWCSALYTLSLYRLYNVYVRSAMGEYTAMIFWPLICWGLSRVLSEEPDIVKERKTVYILAIGYMGVLYCHVLSLEMVIGFTILIGLICFKRFFRKEALLSFIKAAVLAIALSVWFIVPFLDYTMNVDMKVFHVGNPIQILGLYVLQLLWIFPWSGNLSYMYQSGMQDVKAYGIGIGFILVIIAFAYIIMLKRNELKGQKYYPMAKIAAGIGICACTMSLSLFPWDMLSEMSPILESLIFSLQFPYRLLSVATIALTVLAGCVLLLLKNVMGKVRTRCYALAILVFTMMSSFFFMEDDLQHTSWLDIRDVACLGTQRVGNGEYLPYEMDTGALMYFVPNAGPGIVLEEYEKKNCGAEISCQNSSTEDDFIECSLIYYPGYEAKSVETGEKFKVSSGNNQMLRVNVPAGFSGEIQVDFVGRPIWKITDILSACLWFVCVLLIGRSVYKRKNREQSV